MANEITDIQLKQLCKNIEQLTDSNNHTGALKIVCGLLGYEDLHFLLCEIQKLHDKSGHLSEELSHIRTQCSITMFKNIYRDYCSGVYEDIKNSF